MRGLKDKVAIVTGGPGLIGTKTCYRFAEEGCKVVVADIALDKAEALAAELRGKGGEAAAYALDLKDESSIKGMIDFAIEKFGTVDILANLAYGAYLLVEDTSTPFTKMTPALFMETMQVNALGCALACKHVLPTFLKKQGGVIVNVSSIDAIQGNPCRFAYSASKAAIISLAQNIAATYGKMGVRCNTVLPGHIIPGALEDSYPGELGKMMKGSLTTPDVGRGEYIASAIAFLASDDASFINGDYIAVDGGIRSHYAMYSLVNDQKGPSPWWPYHKSYMPEDYPNGWVEE